MNGWKHSYLMVGLVVVGAVLFFSGAVGGSALFLLWPLACMGMMVGMMWWMTRKQGGSDDSRHDDSHHDDLTKHSHR